MAASLRHLVARLKALIRGGRLDRDFAQELDAHLEMLTDDNIRRGLEPGEARRQAAIRLGAASSLQSQHRDVRGFRVLEDLVQDLRFAARLMIKDRWLSAAAIAAIALGIGANTLGFSIVNAAFIRGFQFERVEELHSISWRPTRGRRLGSSVPDFEDWSRARSFRSLAASGFGAVNISDDHAPPEQTQGALITANFFDVLRQPPLLGRTFAEGEDRRGAEPVVIIGYEIWTNRFNRDPQVIGRILKINGKPATIVGIMPERMKFPDDSEIWVPFIPTDVMLTREVRPLSVLGRLQDGVTKEEAATEIDAIAQRILVEHPGQANHVTGSQVETLLERYLNGAAPRMFVVIMGAVIFVLLIACANVANLLLVRATGRRREIAIRAAIGGSRGRIIRQLLTESVVLSLAGGLLGLAAGWLGIRAVLSINTAGLPRVGDNGDLVGLDWTVVAFTVALSLLTGVIFGLIPALQSSKTDLTTTLKESAGRAGTGFRQNKVRSALVVVEVALALVLLIGSALLIRSAMALGRVDPGFDTHNVLTLKMSLKGARFDKAEAVEQVVRSGVEQLRAIPGVVDASATCCVPLQGGYGLPFRVVGRPLAADSQGPFHGGGGWMTVSPGYFEVFRIPVKRGRTFNERDTSASTPVAIINEAMARQFWPDGDPLADRIVIGKGVMREFESEGERQIIGIVADIRSGGLDSDPQPEMFIPQAQVPDAANALNVSLTPLSWVVRTATPPQGLSNAIQDTLRQATGLPVSDVASMDEIAALSVSRQKFNMWVMTVFGACALLLAAIGIYGLMAYAVGQRTQEIGIRLALGAQVSAVRRMVVVQGMALALAGIAIGLAAAFGMSQLITAFLFGVTARDPLVFAAMPVILTAVAFAAVWIPARRASRVDPLIALRYE